MFPYYIQYVSILGRVERTMELTFDYKIKFSEKVYTYILQKKGLGWSLFSKQQSASTMLMQLTRVHATN